MVGLLGFIAEQMEALGIPYEYGEFTGTVAYPYFVGTFQETESRLEDSFTGGVFTLDGWARGQGAQLTLAETCDRIQAAFQDVQSIQNGSLYHVWYGGSFPEPTGEEALYKISITLNTEEWRGE